MYLSWPQNAEACHVFNFVKIVFDRNLVVAGHQTLHTKLREGLTSVLYLMCVVQISVLSRVTPKYFTNFTGTSTVFLASTIKNYQAFSSLWRSLDWSYWYLLTASFLYLSTLLREACITATLCQGNDPFPRCRHQLHIPGRGCHGNSATLEGRKPLTITAGTGILPADILLSQYVPPIWSEWQPSRYVCTRVLPQSTVDVVPLSQTPFTMYLNDVLSNTPSILINTPTASSLAEIALSNPVTSCCAVSTDLPSRHVGFHEGVF